MPSVDGLSAYFCYKDSLVNNLWSLKYLITNIGTETIIGTGTHSQIIDEEKLKLKTCDSALIIDSYMVSSNFPVKFDKNEIFSNNGNPTII
jgi:hypothetical protein